MILCTYSEKDRMKINSISVLSSVSKDNYVDLGQMARLTRAVGYDFSPARKVAD